MKVTTAKVSTAPRYHKFNVHLLLNATDKEYYPFRNIILILCEIKKVKQG